MALTKLTLRTALATAISALLLASCGEANQSRSAASAAQATPRGFNAERLARLDEAMQAYIDQDRMVGATLIIMRDGQQALSKAWGWRDKEANDPMKEDSIFRIASQTKALTSVGVMMLMEEGKLLLEDPVGKYLPEWLETKVAVAKPGGYDVVPAKRAITIRDLLTHTAGIPYNGGPARDAWLEAGILGWYFAEREESMTDVVKRMAALPMSAQPGEQFVYGYATDILGVVIETISDQSLDVFIAERLTNPLGMTDTHFCLPPEKAQRLAVVYSSFYGSVSRAGDPGVNSDGVHIGQGHYLNGPCKAFAGGAGLLSTTHDYARFLEMLRRGGELDGRRYISRKSVELMTVDHLVEPNYPAGTGFGLGFRVITDLGKHGRMASEGEYSWGGAYHSTYWVDPKEGLGVVFLVQLIPTGDIDVQGKLRNLIYQALE